MTQKVAGALEKSKEPGVRSGRARWGGGQGISYFSGVKIPELPGIQRETPFITGLLIPRLSACLGHEAPSCPGLASGWLCYTCPPPFSLWTSSCLGRSFSCRGRGAGQPLVCRCQSKPQGHAQRRGGGAGYPRKVLSMPGLMCRAGGVAGLGF